MKKMIAFILTAAICCSLFGCLAKMTAVEDFLLAIKKMDTEAMCAEMVADETSGSLYRTLKNAKPEADALSVLTELYGLMQYTIGTVSDGEGGAKTVSLTLKLPDMQRIRSLAEAQVLVSGDSAADGVGEMIADGSVGKNMMKEYSVSVKMTEADGVLKIPCGDKENADLVKALALAEMIDFING
jgi:hypothetical protein